MFTEQITKIMDDIAKGFIASLKDIGGMALYLLSVISLGLLAITVPVWIIPYLIYRRAAQQSAHPTKGGQS